MATEFKMPQLGEGAGTGVVVKVLIEEGKTVSPDDSVLEVETDKAIAEVPAGISGVVQEVKVAEGDEVAPDDVIFTYVSADESSEKPPDDESVADDLTTEAKEAAPQEPEVDEREADNSATKQTMEQQPEQPVGDEQPTVPPSSDSLVPAAPSTRRFAREIGIDITRVQGTGPAGRISIDDVKAHAKALNEGRSGGGPRHAVEVTLPDFSKWGAVERQRMTGVRRATAEHMSTAWAAVPHVTHFDQADVTELEAQRKRFGPRVEAAGGKLTPTAIILKVVAAALGLFPRFNSSIDMAGGELILKKYCHIGVAVDTDRGLLVPVIRDVDQKNIMQLSVELTEIAEKTREGKLSLEEMQGGCFTISNLGGIGGTGFTPIVNVPEVAILGVARSRMEPVFQDGEFVPRLVMPLALSYDHRVIDGADAARFLRWIAEALENPLLLSLGS